MKKTIYFILICVTATSCSLLGLDDEVKDNYDSFRFETTGSDEIEFTLTPYDKDVTQYDSLNVNVTKIETQELNINFPLRRTTENAETLNVLYEAMNGERKINGTFEPTLTTGGSTTRLYLQNSDGEVEITNVQLRLELLQFLTYIEIPAGSY